jgi:hypothetical protein
MMQRGADEVAALFCLMALHGAAETAWMPLTF